MGDLYSFESRFTNTSKEDGLDYNKFHFDLMKNGEIFDPELDIKESDQCKNNLVNHFYNSFCKAINFRQSSVVVKLSWFGYDISELTKQYCHGGSQQINLITNYFHWKGKPHSSTNEGFMMLLECNKNLLKDLFKKYWFQVFDEKKMEIIVLDNRQISKILELSRNFIDEIFNSELMSLADYVLDNSHCGFHFYVKTKTAPPEDFRIAFQKKIRLKN